MLALLAVFAGLAPSPIALRMESPQRSVYVAEPLKFVVRIEAREDVELREGQISIGQLQFWVYRANALLYKYVEYPNAIHDGPIRRRSMKKGETTTVNLILTKGGYLRSPEGQLQDGFLLGAPGDYSVRVALVRKGFKDETSAPIAFEVLQPSHHEAPLLREVERDPNLLRAFGSGRQKAEELTSEYPKSTYLRWAAIRLLRTKADELVGGRNPQTGDSLFHGAKTAQPIHTGRLMSELADELLGLGDMGAFEEERLALARELLRNAGAEERAQEVAQMLLDRFPNSVAARAIRTELPGEPRR